MEEKLNTIQELNYNSFVIFKGKLLTYLEKNKISYDIFKRIESVDFTAFNIQTRNLTIDRKLDYSIVISYDQNIDNVSTSAYIGIYDTALYPDTFNIHIKNFDYCLNALTYINTYTFSFFIYSDTEYISTRSCINLELKEKEVLEMINSLINELHEEYKDIQNLKLYLGIVSNDFKLTLEKHIKKRDNLFIV